MHLELVKLSQDFNLESKQTENFLVFRLPDGVLVRLAAPEDVVNQLVHAAVGSSPPSPRSTVQESAAASWNGSSEFGGDYSSEEPQELAPPPRQVAVRAEPAAPARVDKDPYGYPIRYDNAGVDPGEVAGGPNSDEDGVGSV